MLEKMGKTPTVMTAEESERPGTFVLAVALGPASGLSGSFHGRLILAGLVPVMLGTPIRVFAFTNSMTVSGFFTIALNLLIPDVL